MNHGLCAVVENSTPYQLLRRKKKIGLEIEIKRTYFAGQTYYQDKETVKRLEKSTPLSLILYAIENVGVPLAKFNKHGTTLTLGFSERALHRDGEDIFSNKPPKKAEYRTIVDILKETLVERPGKNDNIDGATTIERIGDEFYFTGTGAFFTRSPQDYLDNVLHVPNGQSNSLRIGYNKLLGTRHMTAPAGSYDLARDVGDESFVIVLSSSGTTRVLHDGRVIFGPEELEIHKTAENRYMNQGIDRLDRLVG